MNTLKPVFLMTLMMVLPASERIERLQQLAMSGV